MRHFKTLTFAAGAWAAGSLGCAEDGPKGSTFAINVAPLDGAVAQACYKIEVFEAGSPAAFTTTNEVWTEANLCSGTGNGPQFGVNGELRYTGTCSDSEGDPNGTVNSVRLTINTLQDADGDSLLDDGATNPCPAATGLTGDNGCIVQAPCITNQDTPIEFDLTVAVQATIGFFDIAVRFDEIYCAAKVDCVEEDGTTALNFLQRPDGTDGRTAVVGFACMGAGEFSLLLNDVTVHCQSGADVACTTNAQCAGSNPHCDTALGICASRVAYVELGTNPAASADKEGNVVPIEAPAAASDILFGAAINHGTGNGASAGQDVFYSNVLLGLNNNGVAGETCTLRTWFTADEPLFEIHDTSLWYTTPANSRYPLIDYHVDLTGGATVTCTQHPLGGANGVETVYQTYTGIVDDPALDFQYTYP